MDFTSVDIDKFLENDKITIWPSKLIYRDALRKYLVEKIKPGKIFTESEINEILNQFHTFNDPAFLRRELCDHGLLNRDKYGTKYWRENKV